MLWEIPLTPNPQRFAITLANIDLTMTVAWRNVGGAGWVLDIADANEVRVVSGIPLVTGVNLLGQYPHLGIPGALWVLTDGDTFAVPTFTNLGTGSHLYFDDLLP